VAGPINVTRFFVSSNDLVQTRPLNALATFVERCLKLLDDETKVRIKKGKYLVCCQHETFLSSELLSSTLACFYVILTMSNATLLSISRKPSGVCIASIPSLAL
jgi:hypothetical protein